MMDIGYDNEKLNHYFKGDFPDKDASYVNEIFCDQKREKELEHILKKQWYELLQKNEGADKDLNHILYRIHYEINKKETEFMHHWSFNKIVKWSARIAAIFILPLLVYSGIHYYKVSEKGKTSWIEIKAPKWARVQFYLPDGTTGWLNSSSSLKYNLDFNHDRMVTLSGEAFFDVFKDIESPFIVNTDLVVVNVLGTKFNIASYENEKDVEVVLEEGTLSISNKKMNKSCTMNPNDLVIYNKSLKDFSTKVVQPNNYLSWTEGKLVFKNDPLDVIARRLERWYNIDVEFRGDNFEDFSLRATFIDENLEEVLYFLKRSLPIDYMIENGDLREDETYAKKKVIISHKPNFNL